MPAENGTSGTTIPKPIRSMKTVKKMTRIEGLRFMFKKASGV